MLHIVPSAQDTKAKKTAEQSGGRDLHKFREGKFQMDELQDSDGGYDDFVMADSQTRVHTLDEGNEEDSEANSGERPLLVGGVVDAEALGVQSEVQEGGRELPHTLPCTGVATLP